MLDLRLPAHHNVRVRVRYALIVIALAGLALAGLRLEDPRPIAPLSSAAAATQLAAPPAPDVDPPAIVRAAVTAPANAHSQFACGARITSHPVKDVWTIGRQAPRQPDDGVSRPRTFPLLI